MNSKFMELNFKAYILRKDARHNPKKTLRGLMDEFEEIAREAVYNPESKRLKTTLHLGTWKPEDLNELNKQGDKKSPNLLTANTATEKDRTGTSYIGQITIRYIDLTGKLGKPHKIGSGDNKVDAEWGYRLDKDTVVTVYNYKSKDEAAYETRWHIGGKGNHNLIKEWAEAVFGQRI